MKLKTDTSKLKIVVWSLFTFISIVALANWVATSFGTFDIDMSQRFYKGMDINFFRGWAAYTIEDGYCVIIAYLVPSGILLVECLLKFIKKSKPNWWISQHSYLYKYFIILVGVIFEVVIIYSFYYWNYQDQGFGTGYSMEFVVGKEYTIPNFVVSTLLSNVVFWLLTWWYHCRLAKRNDFLELKLWRNAARIFLYMGYAYLITQIVKAVNPRPYWYAIHFTDGLNYVDENAHISINTSGDSVKGILARYKDLYPNQLAHYLDVDTAHQIGWYGKNGFGTTAGKLTVWPEDLRNFRWYKNANGYPFYSLPAFPSGHMNATIIICLTPTLAFGFNSNSKKINIAKWISYSLGFIYVLDMAFALQMTQSHYWSDIMFSMGWAPIYFIAAHYTTIGLAKTLNIWFSTDKW